MFLVGIFWSQTKNPRNDLVIPSCYTSYLVLVSSIEIQLSLKREKTRDNNKSSIEAATLKKKINNIVTNRIAKSNIANLAN